MPKLRLITGDKRPPPEEVLVHCTCPLESRTFVPTTTGLIRRKGKIIKGPGAVTGWSCLHCKKPIQ